jgi:hypothetical protein
VNSRIALIRELTETDERAWQELGRRAIEPNPLFEPDCLIPASRYLLRGDDMRLVIAEDDGRFFGCFPVLRIASNGRPSGTWRGIRRATLSSQVRRLQFNGTPLIDCERSAEAATALFSRLARSALSLGAGVLVLEDLAADGPVAGYIDGAAKAVGLPLYRYHSWSRPTVRRRTELTYRNSHGGEHRRRLARKARQLGRTLDGEVHVVDRSADESAVDTLLAMEAAGWKGEIGDFAEASPGSPAWFRGGAMMLHPGEPDWFREMCDRFRESGRLVLYSLEVGDTAVAMQLMVRAGEGLFDLVMAYDETYARFSPGMQLVIEAIDRFHETTDAQWIDSCCSESNRTMPRLFPDRRVISTVLVGFGGHFDRFLLRLYAQTFRMLGPDSSLRRRHPRLSAAVDWTASRLRLQPA